MKRERIFTGMSRRVAVRTTRRWGGSVEPRKGTGEVVFRHPAQQRPVVMNNRRKDTSREVVSWLRELDVSLAGAR